jgi:hypothetical protein
MAARRRGATPRPKPRLRTRAARPRSTHPSSPGAARLVLYALLGLMALVAADFLYQVIRKPTELFFPVSGVLYKTPTESWRAYGALFRRYSTSLIDAQLLGALAQVEASGNPLVRTYWRWSWSAPLIDMYRPASSAVGMFQITDPTLGEASQYCIHDHQLVHAGAWDDWHSCWFNRLYLRVLPADAVELTAAYLDLKVSGILANGGRHPASAAQVRHLAAVVHLCGAGAAAGYARRSFQFTAGQRCGDHDPREYLARVDAAREAFVRLSAQEPAAAAQ